jgi:hypothetical protein
MRRILCAVTLLAAASTLFAADPFEGTWKLNTGQSKSSATPKQETIVIAKQGDNYQVTITGTDANGAPISVKYTAPASGGPAKILEGPYDAISTKRIDDTTRETTYMKGGKEIRSSRGVAAKDGKSLRVTFKGIDGDGKPAMGALTFDRQPGT